MVGAVADENFVFRRVSGSCGGGVMMGCSGRFGKTRTQIDFNFVKIHDIFILYHRWQKSLWRCGVVRVWEIVTGRRVR